MVNLRYRELPVMQMARALVEDGMVGEIRHIDAAYLQSWLVGTHWGDWRTEERWLWRLSGAHGSRGVLGDVGIHILDFASYVADQKPVSVHCRMKTFGKAEGDRIGAYGLDANDSFVMSIEFDGGALGVVHASRWMTGYANAMKLGVLRHEGRAGDLVREREDGPARLRRTGRATRRPGARSNARPCRTPTRPSSTRCAGARRSSRAFAAPPSCSTCSISRSSRIGWEQRCRSITPQRSPARPNSRRLLRRRRPDNARSGRFLELRLVVGKILRRRLDRHLGVADGRDEEVTLFRGPDAADVERSVILEVLQPL